jgi:hypothetical protein
MPSRPFKINASRFFNRELQNSFCCQSGKPAFIFEEKVKPPKSLML